MLRIYIFILLMTLMLSANADDSSEQLWQVPDVETNIDSSDISHFQTTANATVITSQQIQQSGATTIAQLLQNQPGVQLADLNGDGSNIAVSMRGFGANAASNSLILINGQPLTNPDIGDPNLQLINVNDIQRIEILPGSAGVLYGDQAVGGVINIITKQPKHLTGSLSAGLGSYNTQNYHAGIGNSFKNGFSFLVNGDLQRSNNYRDNDEGNNENLYGMAAYQYRSGKISASYQLNNDSQQYPGALTAQQVDQNRKQSQPGADSFANTLTQLYNVNWKQDLSQDWQLKTSYSGQYGDTNGVLVSTPFTQTRINNYINPKAIGSIDVKHGTLLVTLGSDGTADSYQYTSNFSGGSSNTTSQRYGGSLYGQLQYPITEKLNITLGARGAHNRDDITGVGSNKDNAFITNEGVAYQLNSLLKLFARRAGNYRFPKTDEEINYLPNGQAVPNPLKAQTGVSYETGVKLHKNTLTTKLTLFQLNLKNEIAYAPSDGSDVLYNNRNLDPTKRDGIILSGHWQAFKKLRLSGQYSYVNARFDSGPNKGNDIPFVAANTFRLSGDYNFCQHWDIYVEELFTGSRYPSGDDSNSQPKQPAFSIVNLNLTYHYKKWLASAKINNLLDKQYNAYATFSPFSGETFYPAPGINVLATIKYKLG